jgi:hypothetical protein
MLTVKNNNLKTKWHHTHLYTTNAKYNHQELHKPVRHQFVKHYEKE